MTPDDEFYIGYEAAVPSAIGRQVRRAGCVLAVVLVAAASVVVFGHRRLSPSRFDFGDPRPVSGWLDRRPYPALTIDGRRAWLVGQGKHGAEAALAQVADGPVTLLGTSIERGPHTMLEVVAGSASTAAAIDPPGNGETTSTAADGAEVTLAGEVVDSKCFLGVMNPGDGTVHRDCARLCLRGGVPPMLLVRGGMGEEALVLLVDRQGRAIGTALADLAGVPVDVRGQLSRDRRGLVLAADVGDFRRRRR